MEINNRIKGLEFRKHFMRNNCIAEAPGEKAHHEGAKRSMYIDLAPMGITEALPNPPAYQKEKGTLVSSIYWQREGKERLFFVNILLNKTRNEI